MRLMLIILGIVLLLPGLCGTYYLGVLFWFQLAAEKIGFTELEDLLWLWAHSSLMVGCFGFFILALLFPTSWILRITRAIGFLALLLTVTVYALYAIKLCYIVPSGYLKKLIVPTLWIWGGYLLGGLPALLVGRWMEEEWMAPAVRGYLSIMAVLFLMAGVFVFYSKGVADLPTTLLQVGITAGMLLAAGLLIAWAGKGATRG